MVKTDEWTCECGTKNPAKETKCLKCGKERSMESFYEDFYDRSDGAERMRKEVGK